MFGFVFIYVFDHDESEALSHLLEKPLLCWIKVELFDIGPHRGLSLLKCLQPHPVPLDLFLPALSSLTGLSKAVH